jgi:putative transcriptional regulator
MSRSTSLQGKILIAMPALGDYYFGKSLVFLCKHSDQGAIGLVVNKASPEISLAKLLAEVNIEAKGNSALQQTPVRIGGPVDQHRGFVLHSSDYSGDDTSLRIGRDFRLTATRDVLQDIAAGKGPARSLVALGYAGWQPGQLEAELMHNSWLHCDADSDLIFGPELGTKYDSALAKIGVDARMLSSEVGHA